MNQTPRRIRAIREALHFNQTEFAQIFRSQKVKDKTLSYRAVSHWETGHSEPTHIQLRELVKFLVNPAPWLKRHYGIERYSKWIALRFLVWYQTWDLDVEYGTLLANPATAKNREQRIGRVVYDVLDQQLPDRVWEKMLASMSAHSSKAWNQEVLTAKEYFGRSGELSRERFEKLLQRDIEVHGPGIIHLVGPNMESRRAEIEEYVHRRTDLASALKPGLIIDDQPFSDWWGSRTWRDKGNFARGVKAALDAVQGFDGKHLDLLLARLRTTVCEIDFDLACRYQYDVEDRRLQEMKQRLAENAAISPKEAGEAIGILTNVLFDQDSNESKGVRKVSPSTREAANSLSKSIEDYSNILTGLGFESEHPDPRVIAPKMLSYEEIRNV